MAQKFNKRLYPSIKDLVADFKFVFSNRDKMRLLMRGGAISPAFRERLMLAVTEVNGCRYCAYYHTKLALEAGLDSEEIAEMGEKSFVNCPPEEQPALLYAQHWAEANAQPDPAARETVLAQYGAEKLVLIELSMRVIRVGNLLGNLADYILFKLSFGKFNPNKSLS